MTVRPAGAFLDVRGLSVGRGGVTLLAGVTFGLSGGEALVLTGPNGRGKTTLIRTLVGLQPPWAGDFAAAPFLYAGHLDGIKGQLTAAENLAFWAETGGGGDVAAALAAFDLGALAGRPARMLSAGQKRRLGLARLALAPRSLWILDEPTVSLDVHAVGAFARVVEAHLAAGGAALLATHVPLGLDARRSRARRRVRRRLVRALVVRDLRLALRAGGGFGLGLAFYLVVAVLVPLGIGPDPAVLARIAPGVLWVGALLAALLSLDRMFALDHEDGSLDLLATSPLPLEAVALAKMLAHWLVTGLPLALAAPVLGLLLSLAPEGYPWLVASLVVGTPALSAIGCFGAALTVGLKRGGLLLSLLVLPMYVPTLVFGALAVIRGATGGDALTPLALLAGVSLAALALLPFAAALALRLNLR